MNRFALLPAVAATLLAATAHAGDQTASSSWSYVVGGGALVAPNYEGSKHYVIQPLPMLEASWRDTVSLSTTDGLKVTMRPLSDQGFFVSGDLGDWQGRKEGVDKHHGDTLRGLGNLSGGAVGKLETGYQYNAASIGLDVARDIGNDRDGTMVTLRGGYKIYKGNKLNIGSEISSTWDDDNYMNNIFGITAAQSRNSLKHYAPFKAGSGIKDVKFGLTASYDITRSVSLIAMIDVARLLGDAADSPIVKTQGSDEQISGGMGLTYRF